MISVQNSCPNRLWRVSIFVLLAGALAVCQSNPSEHVFQVSRAELDKALAGLHVNSPGRLPILDGFVASDNSLLDKYQRAYYQYKLEIRPAGAGATAVRVTAKVTAWYAGDNSSSAGYRVLQSNGRLETDLLERLEDSLQQKSASVATKVSECPRRERAQHVFPGYTNKRSRFRRGKIGAAGKVFGFWPWLSD